MVSKLRKNPQQLRDYDNIINDYLKDVIVQEVTPINKTDAVHYLLHRAVVKEERETCFCQISRGKVIE